MALTAQQQKRFEKLTTFVTLRIDEYAEQIEGGVPDSPVGDIQNELQEAAKAILRRMQRYPAFGAATKQYKPVALDESDRGGSVVPLADDFLRFVSVKMEGWKRPATDWVADTSRIYQQQIYDQRRATPDKPVAAMIPFLDEYQRHFAEDAGTYHDADEAEQARIVIELGGWVRATVQHPDSPAPTLEFTLDGQVQVVGGISAAIDYSGAQAAQILAQMLNGEYVEGAIGYKALPEGYSASSSSNKLTIWRDEKEYNPMTISYTGAFLSEIDVVDTVLHDGFSGAPIEGDILKKGTDPVGQVLKVDADAGRAVLKLDQGFLSLSDLLTPESGKYEIKITELKSKKHTGTTDAKRALEVFPADSTVEHVYYVPYLHPAEMPSEFDDALVYRATSAIFMGMRQAKLADAAMQRAELALQELNAGQYGSGGQHGG